MSKSPKILLYGATGYTGKLTVELMSTDPSLKWFKDKVIIGGRNPEAVRKLAEKYKLPFVVFPVDSDLAIDEALKNVPVLLNMAGPFIKTVEPLIKGCIRNKVHYLDITGEQPALKVIFEKYKNQIKEAGIFAVPAVGFDVISTDCVAGMLKAALPSADKLELGFCIGRFDQSQPTSIPISKGTSVSALEVFASDHSFTRKDGKLVAVNSFYRTREIDFKGVGKKFCGFIPAGDAYTAFISTGIPNIDVFFPVPRFAPIITKIFAAPLMFLFRFVPFLKAFIIFMVQKLIVGPNSSARENTFMSIWGEACDTKTNQCVRQCVTTPESYTFTVYSSLESAKRLAEEKNLAVKFPGAYSPCIAFGKDLVKQIPKLIVHPQEKFTCNPKCSS